jgi:hypothetical protein
VFTLRAVESNAHIYACGAHTFTILND